ncbi:oligogalacturonate lyase family protein [Roseiflexus sp.]|uniref:oligogalacturonate lyase family protein n=1 Tax=Roseiflexus sp. TaxID=2562120 RepID=UPI00398B5674
MTKGATYPAEQRTFYDRHTGVRITQLTAHKAHSHHLYFTNPGWYDGGQKLLFGSERGNRVNLYSLDLTDGTITQLTDLDQPPPPGETSFLFASVNPVRSEVYFWHGRDLVALDLHTLEERRIYRAPDRFLTNITNVTADGRYVCTALYEDLSDRFAIDLLHGYVGFAEYWEARPLSQIIRIDGETGAADVIFEEHAWIGHVNTSPTLPNILTYCHEGPWQKVDHRIWGLDMASGKTWKIRPTSPGERVGHEYWFADGERIGYHGRAADGEPFYGCIRYDNTDRIEAPFPTDSTHVHSNDLNLIVGDGSRTFPWLMLWRFRDGVFEGPRAVAYHRGSFQVQITHVHPRFSPDGRQILYVSDDSGYGNLYLTDTPDFESLPPPAS